MESIIIQPDHAVTIL